MSKRSDNPGGMGGLGKQIKKMQEEMVRAQQELAEETLEVTAGGGAITVDNLAKQYLTIVLDGLTAPGRPE